MAKKVEDVRDPPAIKQLLQALEPSDRAFYQWYAQATHHTVLQVFYAVLSDFSKGAIELETDSRPHFREELDALAKVDDVISKVEGA